MFLLLSLMKYEKSEEFEFISVHICGFGEILCWYLLLLTPLALVH
jgi:hypothetical protein